MTQKWPASSSSRPTFWEWSHETSRSTLFEAIARMVEAESVRRERLEVRHCRGVLTLEPDGELLLVPTFTYLKDELLAAAATGGVLDRRIEAYLDSLFAFASPYLEEPGLVELLEASGGYETTETAFFGHAPPSGAALTRDRRLSLVRQTCRRFEEQVGSLGRRFGAALPADRRDRGATNPQGSSEARELCPREVRPRERG